ncbi:type IV pilin protein [Francisella sp. 19X1-34]|uniref:type IV pilin protein n=1 Tax=Francisella sp. 19X1-34 TaxID=3087177 RepID=UPI002E32C658|nr:type IV pilin protein [Francisella sp. 19X1-34]MED7787914.1 type IV pilin protein [Francisella sp. 19X1-34]
MFKKNLFIKGFSLVELMVVIAIIAILASIGIPMYNNYTLRSHRSEATSELLSASNAADSYEIRNGSFPSGSNINSFYHENSQSGLYRLAYASINSGSGYTITATAQGAQTADTPCTNIELQVSGAIIDKTPVACWN